VTADIYRNIIKKVWFLPHKCQCYSFVVIDLLILFSEIIAIFLCNTQHPSVHLRTTCMVSDR